MVKIIKLFHFCLCFGTLCFIHFKVDVLRGFFSDLCALVALLYLAQWLMEETKRYVSINISSDKRAVLITGCDTGFGNLLARKLDKLGYHVFACCMNVQGQGPEDLKSTCSSRLQIVEMDVTKDESVREAYETVKANIKDNMLWAIVNNAGVVQIGEIDLCPMYDFQKVLEVNTLGPLRVSKTFLPLVKKSKGRIVNICSNIGRKAYPGFVGYAMSKSAAISLTEGMRVELNKWGVDVIGIEPYFYKTPMTAPGNVFGQLEDMWNRVPTDIKKEYYDENYLASCKAMTTSIISLSSTHIEDVLDCLVDSVISREPLSVYFPCYTPLKALLKLALLLPPVVFETAQVWYFNYYTKLRTKIEDSKVNKSG